MGIIELFSKRQKRLRGEIPEVLTFDNIPQTLRVQIVHIIRDTIGEDRNYGGHYASDIYKLIQETLCREYGVFTLTKNSYEEGFQQQVLNFFLQTNEVEKAIDVIELTFRCIERIIGGNDYWQYEQNTETKLKPTEAVGELNERFKENGVGYLYESNRIIKVDSTYIHSEITKPTINLLWNMKFIGANEEYLKAHEHYRHGRNKECLTDCLKAFESVMKIICTEKGWEFNPTDTSKKLIQICFQNGLVPTFTQNQFTSLQNLLESGIPTIRNKLGSHGQGQTPQKVDDEMTRYAMNLTGSNIIFLVEQSGIK